MAVLGAQLVITLVMISIIQKLGPHFSVGRWLLCSTGLVRYLYPTDNELKQSANIPREKPKYRKFAKAYSNGRTRDLFHIPRNLDIELEFSKITRLDVIHLKYYTEYQWLVDFSIYAVIVYLITEIYQVWFPLREEINLSAIWCTLVIVFAFKLLLSVTVQYFQGEEAVGERSTCIVMGFVYLLISMIVLIIDENTLELGLERAYYNFNESASKFLQSQGMDSSGPASKIVLKFFIALWCGILGSLLTFPGLRVARMHWDLVKQYQSKISIQAWLNFTFALPFLLVVLWIKPIARDYFTLRVFPGREGPLLSDDGFDSFRVLIVAFTMITKLILTPWYLQSYLNLAHRRIEEQKKEVGRITNIDYQKKIGSVFYYLCIATLQYLAPILICLYLTFIYKTLGEYNWTGTLLQTNTTNITESVVPKTIDPFEFGIETKSKASEEFQLALDSLKCVFTARVLRGLLGFAAWWTYFVYFASTSLGLVYQSYFTSI